MCAHSLYIALIGFPHPTERYEYCSLFIDYIYTRVNCISHIVPNARPPLWFLFIYKGLSTVYSLGYLGKLVQRCAGHNWPQKAGNTGNRICDGGAAFAVR